MLKNEKVRDKYVLTSQMPPFPSETSDQFMDIGAKMMEGKLPLSPERYVEIYKKVPNIKCSEFYHKIGMPQALASEKEKK
jgi:hypothetical protein